ncbi:MAG: hypothetical protein Q9209_000432 [Squamulea sp. 1 TL-2023]
MEETHPTAALCSGDRGPLLLAVGWILLGLAILIVATRIYLRSNLRHGINWDDYLIVASLVIGIIGGSFLTRLVQVGGGKHIDCLPHGQIYPVLKWTLLAQVCNVLGIGLVKVSVCLCVLRLIDRARRRLSQFLWVMIGIVTVSHLIQALIFLVQCRPLNALWNPKVKGTCFSWRVTYTAGYANYGLDALTDLVCAIIPVSVIHQLQMNTRTKAALSLLMSLGVLTAGFAIAKCVTLRALFEQDFSWNITEPGVFTIVEHYLGIIIASMPALKPLFSKILDATGSSSSPNSSKRNFQKIHSFGPTACGPGSHAPSGRSSIGEGNIKRTTEVRISSHLEFEINRDYELQQHGQPPDYLRHSGNSWALEPVSERKEQNLGIPTGGYRHLDDSFPPTSVPRISNGASFVRTPK